MGGGALPPRGSRPQALVLLLALWKARDLPCGVKAGGDLPFLAPQRQGVGLPLPALREERAPGAGHRPGGRRGRVLPTHCGSYTALVLTASLSLPGRWLLHVRRLLHVQRVQMHLLQEE